MARPNYDNDTGMITFTHTPEEEDVINLKKQVKFLSNKVDSLQKDLDIIMKLFRSILDKEVE